MFPTGNSSIQHSFHLFATILGSIVCETKKRSRSDVLSKTQTGRHPMPFVRA